MCGIAGIIAWDETYRVSRERLLAMSAAIAHRGPDGEGIFLTREHEPITVDTPQVGFAFRRLAILDPDARAMQPFTIGSQTIVFNGEIYNYRELREEVKKLRPDYEWRTTGDTEVLLLGYSIFGEKYLDKLNGMFALAIWDDVKHSIFLARDRMGQKPLYIHRNDRFLAFASEPSAVDIALDLTAEKLRPETLVDYLRYGCGITASLSRYQLMPASCARYAAGNDLDAHEYFDQDFDQDDGRRLSVNATRSLVEQAVHRQLVSDVPLGVFLSGGIDSSIVALCARQCGPVKTFSIAFDDPRYDESVYAEKVAKHLGTEHHVFRVTPDAAEDLPKIATAFGEPFADSSIIPTYYLCRETRKHVTVALSGDGGDELFGGYERYRAMYLASKLQWLPNFARRMFVSTNSHPKSLRAKWTRFAKSLDQSPAKRYASYMRFFDDAMLRELLIDGAGLDQSDPIAMKFEQFMNDGRDEVQAALAADRVTYLPNDLLAKVDRCSMLNSLEVRSPFMDHELVRFAAGLSTKRLLQGGGKRMLREAFAKDLPWFVFKRKKMGFAVPIGEWFRGPLRDMLRDYLFAKDSVASRTFKKLPLQTLVDDHERGRADHSQRLFALLMLELTALSALSVRGERPGEGS